MQNIVLSKKRWTNYQIIITTSYYCFNVKDDAIPLNSPTKVCRVPNTQYLVKEGNFGPRYIHIYIYAQQTSSNGRTGVQTFRQ